MREVHSSYLEINYDKIVKLGSGHCGSVYKYLSLTDQNFYAVKIISRHLYKREHEILRDLDHTNVIKMRDYFRTETDVVLVLDYCAGKSINYHKPNYAEIRKYMFDIVDGLEYLHSRNIIHNDIKPENILISDGKAVICDFDLSVISVNPIHGSPGTFIFMAPEQILDKLYLHDVDIRALGLVLYELVFEDNIFTTDCTTDIYTVNSYLEREKVNSSSLKALLHLFPNDRVMIYNILHDKFKIDYSPFSYLINRLILHRIPFDEIRVLLHEINL